MDFLKLLLGWKFRKRIRIIPGLTLNLSKKGISTTIGGRGLSINKGAKGTYLNLGIPGTGLYNRVKLDSEEDSKPERTVVKKPKPEPWPKDWIKKRRT